MSDVRTQIETAVLTLARRCDGARTEDGIGYNRYDAPWGARAADKIAAGQPLDLTAALRVVSKYRKQLERAGLELPDADVLRETLATATPAPVAAAPSGVTITPAGGKMLALQTLAIRFPYDAELVATARALPGRRFDGATKAWIVPRSALEQVLAAFPGAEVDPSILAARDAATTAHAEAETARLATIATDMARYESFDRAGLYAHQDAGIRWLIEHRFAILADDMGVGKTRQSLVAAKALDARMVVIAPAGLRINWLREAETVGVRVEVYSWSKVPEPINGAFTLIADEAHYAQNLKAARTKKFLALANASTACFALTGTPIKNGRPAGLFPLLVATKHPLAKDKKHFEIRYCNAGPTRWSPWDVTGAAHLEELHEQLAPGLLRRMKSECLDLPAKTRVLRKAELSADSQAMYSATLADMQNQYQAKKAAGELKGDADALVLLNHLRHAGSLAKVESATELAQEIIEQGGSVVLFTAFTDSAAQLATALRAGKITGAEDAEQRQHAVDAFQRGALKSIVCTLGAGNVGITLTAAQTVILVDRPWTPGDAIQAEDRLHRIGQTGNVLAVWLQANGADEAIDALLEEKHERIELVLAGKRKALHRISSISDVAEAVLGA